MNSKKTLLAVVALVVSAALFLGIYFITRPKTEDGTKTFTVTVVHKDGTARDFTYTSDEDYLGSVLVAEGLIQGEDGSYGLYINTADGETADWNADSSFWSLYEGDTQAVRGVDTTPITDGGIYKLVYTIG